MPLLDRLSCARHLPFRFLGSSRFGLLLGQLFVSYLFDRRVYWSCIQRIMQGIVANTERRTWARNILPTFAGYAVIGRPRARQRSLSTISIGSTWGITEMNVGLCILFVLLVRQVD